ncbi:hypothetical protein [Kaistella antarctica]|uniref:PorT family protein n=1 Tax=Kaistella antarctica TaxID=266748 RepID=A0A448NMH0_9FLAO|nr:hypothetical protein [Kaistella antarctica]KEY20081.1 hypothetical protein HY04_02335 [Kaistella antarctica]SEV93946.1 hypothetical protein SAMN05421765_1303 [Kaistella antarctica]VEH95420.1 Uncharacterised protein [Kaistella antarctica]
MKKTILLFAVLLSLVAFAQIRFEKAYYIDNSDNRVECLIKNVDWKNNPDFFNYQLGENAEIRTATVKEVKVFEIYNQSKFIRSIVDFDKSSINIRNLSESKEPEFVQRQLFLKQLVTGAANLYKYEEGNDAKFFYQKGSEEIKPLIYKPFQLELYQIAYNESYKQQLSAALNCGGMNNNQTNSLKYKEKDMVEIFSKYNECSDPNYITAAPIKKGGTIHLSVRPRVSLSSLQLTNSMTRDVFEFGDNTGLGVGVELEYVLPFNKSKWAIILEPTYRTYKAETVIEPFYMAGMKLFAFADYQSIEVPIGIRHYMYIDSNSRIFLNAQYVFDLNLGSSLEVKRADGFVTQNIDVDAFSNFAIGAGYSYKSKYGAEIRYFTNRNIVKGYPNFSTSYSNVSLILSYTIF